MRKWKVWSSKVVAFFLMSLMVTESAYPCSTAYIPESSGKLMGKNYVWSHGYGRVFLNRKNMLKRALLKDPKTMKGVMWKAKYASLSFNQIAENFPVGGMNTEGLGVEILLATAEFPKSTDLEAVSELQWIQYLLDTSSNVTEAIAQARKVDIVPIAGYSVHYHVCDKEGECAVFEYKDGKLAVFDRESEGQTPVGTDNSCYGSNSYSGKALRSLEAAELIPGLESPILPKVTRASDRCASTRRLVEAFSANVTRNSEEEVDDMFQLMNRISGNPQWQIVYELAKGRMHFKAQVGGGTIRTISFADFTGASDLDCSQAFAMHEASRNVFVRPPLRFNLNGKSVPTAVPSRVEGGDSSFGTIVKSKSVLKRENFSSYIETPTLLMESTSFLSSNGIDKAMVDQVFRYQGTHTSCAEPE